MTNHHLQIVFFPDKGHVNCTKYAGELIYLLYNAFPYYELEDLSIRNDIVTLINAGGVNNPYRLY